MPYIVILPKRYPLEVGANTVGGDDAAVPVRSGVTGTFAIIDLEPDGRATMRRTGTDVTLRIDGASVDGERVQLSHGVKIVLDGTKMAYVDQRFTGGTDHVEGVGDEDDPAPLDRIAVSESTADTGGRLISLAEEREYRVPDAGLDIGRDPFCDIVLASNDVSRWHAQIVPGVLGYQIKDSSTNGVYVNDARVDGAAWLGFGDVIRVGAAEFRFEADRASYEPRVPDATPTAELKQRVSAPAPAELSRPSSPAPGETAEVARFEGDASRRSAAPLLATLEIINEGVLRGRRYRVTAALTHVGRGPHNDIILPDESVSGSHAKLHRRGAEWFVVDASSRNGTYVDGERVHDDRALSGVAELRFGGIKTLFRPLPAPRAEVPGTRSIVGVTDDQLKKRG